MIGDVGPETIQFLSVYRHIIVYVWTSISLLALTVAVAIPFIARDEREATRQEFRNTPPTNALDWILALATYVTSEYIYRASIAFVVINLFFAVGGLTALLIPADTEGGIVRGSVVSTLLTMAQITIGFVQYCIFKVTLTVRNARRDWNREYILKYRNG